MYKIGWQYSNYIGYCQFFCYDKEKYSCILEEKMNTVCRDIFRAIHENKWLSIEYKNKQEGITKYWIGIMDVNPMKRSLCVEGLHLGQLSTIGLNIYIDSILSYGVIGTILVLCYTFVLNKEIFTSNTRKENPALFGMMMCFIAIVLIYGLLDCTLNIVATGTLCFIILNSACMYLEK